MAVLLTGCNTGTATPAASAEQVATTAQQSLNQRDSGEVRFALHASADDGGPVGFEIAGRYHFEEGNELAVLDLTYTVLLDEESNETRVVSTGDEAWVVVDGEATPLTEEQAEPLRMGDTGRSEAIPAVDLGAWLRDGEVQRKGERTKVAGQVNAAAFVRDLQRLASDVTGAQRDEVDEPTAGQIDRAVTDSEMTMVTEDDELRSVRVTVDFGARVPPALREALGSYAGVTMDLSIDIDDIETPLEIEPPS